MATATTPSTVQRKTQEQVLQSVKESQKTVLEAVSSWADVAGRSTGSIPSLPKDLPSVKVIVEDAFDFAAKLLETQRQFAVGVLGAVTPIVEKAAGTKEATPVA